MWSSIAVILIAAVGTQTQSITTSTGCVCVIYYMCSLNNTIITDGSGQLGGRGGPAEYEECVCPSDKYPSGQQCGDFMQRCCHVPEETATSEVPPGPADTPAPPPGPADTPAPPPGPADTPAPPPGPADTPAPPPGPADTPAPPPGPEETTTEEPESWDDCGIKGFNPRDVTGKVIASEEMSVTFSGEFPWMAMVLNRSDNSMVCGGSILHHHVVMTAAHCVRRFQATDVLVRVGVWNTKDLRESETREVERILRHAQFGGDNYRNDIALLVLRHGLELSNAVAPICRPQPNALYDNIKCMATGWGVSRYTQRNYSETLRKVELQIVPHAQCQKELQASRLGPFFRLHNSFVCAKGEDNADTCLGDGGGPLICPERGTDRYVQVGIVAAGLECANGLPALYTNIPRLMPWINQKFEEWNLEKLEF